MTFNQPNENNENYEILHDIIFRWMLDNKTDLLYTTVSNLEESILKLFTLKQPVVSEKAVDENCYGCSNTFRPGVCSECCSRNYVWKIQH
jgi:hypothetical protein